MAYVEVCTKVQFHDAPVVGDQQILSIVGKREPVRRLNGTVGPHEREGGLLLGRLGVGSVNGGGG